MLVLSRRESEKILFPTLGISVEVLNIQGRKARIGIDAPADIPVLRHECAVKDGKLGRGIAGKGMEFTSDLIESNQKLSELFHVIHKRLDNAASTLNELHRASRPITTWIRLRRRLCRICLRNSARWRPKRTKCWRGRGFSERPRRRPCWSRTVLANAIVGRLSGVERI